MALKLVWSPMKIGPVTIPNRVVRTSHTTSHLGGATSELSDDLIAYHVSRARAGVGMSVLQAATVHDASSHLGYAVDDAVMPRYEQLVREVQPHGMRLFQQLWHGGHNMLGAGGAMPWAPSALPSPFSGIVGVPMGQAEIDTIVDAFAAAALRCRDSGIDGVEVHAGHGYLVNQFLSSATNDRDDEYGGDLLQRTRFLREILIAVRERVGPEYPIGVRMGASTSVGGLSAADVATIAAHLEKHGWIDFLDITLSDYFDFPSMIHSMAFPSGYQMPYSRVVSEAVSVPTIVTGRFRTLEEVEQVLRDGTADFVSMVRAQIADPELVLKTREGRIDDVRPCIACNQGCSGGLIRAGRMQCTVNPAAGFEREMDERLIRLAEMPRKVMVVGGGPAGLEAARIAALRGHRVILAEASARLGGAVDIARRAPHLHIFQDLLSWYERQIYALGVDVRLSSFVELADIAAEQPDVVIVATGSFPRGDGRQAAIPGEIPEGVRHPHVLTSMQLILDHRGEDLSGQRALVLDDIGHYEAIAAAEILTGGGASVTYVTTQSSFGPKLLGTGRETEALSRLYASSFQLHVSHRLVRIDPDACTIRPLAGGREQVVSADLVVLVTANAPIRNLFDELRDNPCETLLVGDALSPRDMLSAIHEGHRAARGIQ
jgi:2,4-dienoyl-CoA reductase-like NADH-dependent reductase (Old Yellow Enzyme family)